MKLGGAQLVGAARSGPKGWNGAGAGAFGKIPIGVVVKNSSLSGQGFISDQWLPSELDKAGIKPE